MKCEDQKNTLKNRRDLFLAGIFLPSRRSLILADRCRVSRGPFDFMAEWIESDVDIWDHHKTIRLCSVLKKPDYSIVGHLMSLWHFTLRNAWRDADLSKWGDGGIERAARWDGEPGQFVAGLREVGFLDNSSIHGWMERAGKLVSGRLYNEERRNNAALRRNDAVKRRKTVATVPDRTVPDQTIPKDKDIGAQTAPTVSKAFVKPSLEDVKAYCLERQNSVDAEAFLAFYDSNGWRVGRNPMKDWRAAVRTWEKNSFAKSKADQDEKAIEKKWRDHNASVDKLLERSTTPRSR